MDTDGDKLNFKLLPPPSYLPILGSTQDANVSYFGRTNYVQGLYRQKDVFGLKRVVSMVIFFHMIVHYFHTIPLALCFLISLKKME